MLRLAKYSFLLLILSLPLMKLSTRIGGFEVNATDLLFLIAAGTWGLALLTGRTTLRWHRLYWLLLVYFLAMLASAFASPQPMQAAFKLATQAYLLSLPVLGYSLIDSIDELRCALRWWLAASAIVAIVGVATVSLFAAGRGGPLVSYGLHEYGTLPAGPYRRIEATFEYPALLCNYLTVSLLILLASRRMGWVPASSFWLLLIGICVTAAFSLTPGLGGFVLAVALWLWLLFRERYRAFATLALLGGAGAALLFVLAASVTPILHPTAPFLIDVPGTDIRLAPSVRLLTWIDACRNFLAHPLLGLGIGTPAAGVPYVGPSGARYFQTDAHNMFLNVAAQTGLLGLGALLLLIAGVARETGRWRLAHGNALRLALSLAWLNAFVYQGLTGSYEDARYLYVLLSLLMAGIRLEREAFAQRHA